MSAATSIEWTDRTWNPVRGCSSTRSYRGGFAVTWDSLYAKKGLGWGSNPWVWVVQFEREKEPAR